MKASLLENLVKIKDAEISLLERQVQTLQEDIRRLLNPPPPKFSPVKLWESEDEADIRTAKEKGLIGAKEAEDLLKQLQFENTQIIIDEEDDSPEDFRSLL
ncbi:MAG: hypothetical protein QXQ02_03720 [Halobacteria archaeon]